MSQTSRSQQRSRSVRRRLAAFGALVVLFVAPAEGRAPRDLLSAEAPDFVLRSLAGNNVRLSEYRGEVVAVSFWTVGCGRCRRQLSQLDDLLARHRERGFRYVSVNVDGPSAPAADVVTALGLEGPTLLDTDKAVSRLYDLGRLPLTLLIDHSGVVRYVQSGQRGGSGEQLRSELENLLAE